MTDRAKKITELQVTTSVANTDKFVVVKDAANATIATTRSISLGSLAQSLTPLVQAPVPNTTFVSNAVSVISAGETLVPWFSYQVPASKTGCIEIRVHARDDQNITTGIIFAAVNSTAIDFNHTVVASVGQNTIQFNHLPTMNSETNTVTLFFNRAEPSTNAVTVRYAITIF
jgi:hypothetical protein